MHLCFFWFFGFFVNEYCLSPFGLLLQNTTTIQLRRNRNLRLTAGEAESPKSNLQRGCVLAEALPGSEPLPFRCIFTCQKRKDTLQSLRLKNINPIHQGSTPLMTKRPHLLMSSFLGFRASTYEFGGNTNIHSIADTR